MWRPGTHPDISFLVSPTRHCLLSQAEKPILKIAEKVELVLKWRWGFSQCWGLWEHTLVSCLSSGVEWSHFCLDTIRVPTWHHSGPGLVLRTIALSWRWVAVILLSPTYHHLIQREKTGEHWRDDCDISRDGTQCQQTDQSTTPQWLLPSVFSMRGTGLGGECGNYEVDNDNMIWRGGGGGGAGEL